MSFYDVGAPQGGHQFFEPVILDLWNVSGSTTAIGDVMAIDTLCLNGNADPSLFHGELNDPLSCVISYADSKQANMMVVVALEVTADDQKGRFLLKGYCENVKCTTTTAEETAAGTLLGITMSAAQPGYYTVDAASATADELHPPSAVGERIIFVPRHATAAKRFVTNTTTLLAGFFDGTGGFGYVHAG